MRHWYRCSRWASAPLVTMPVCPQRHLCRPSTSTTVTAARVIGAGGSRIRDTICRRGDAQERHWRATARRGSEIAVIRPSRSEVLRNRGQAALGRQLQSEATRREHNPTPSKSAAAGPFPHLFLICARVPLAEVRAPSLSPYGEHRNDAHLSGGHGALSRSAGPQSGVGARVSTSDRVASVCFLCMRECNVHRELKREFRCLAG